MLKKKRMNQVLIIVGVCALTMLGAGCTKALDDNVKSETGNNESREFVSETVSTTEEVTGTRETESEQVSENPGEESMQTEEVRVYICFDETQMQTVSLEEQVKLLEATVPTDVTFEVRRMDTDGYAVVVRTVKGILPLLEQASNVKGVTVDIPAETTGQTGKQLETE